MNSTKQRKIIDYRISIFDIIGAAILLAILIGCCLCCTKACQRKKRPENRRKRRRQQKNARRKRRRQQRNCPAPHPPPSANPQTRIQIANPLPQQQQTSAPRAPVPPPGYQNALPHQQYPNSSSQPILQFHNQQYPNSLSQPPQTQQFVFAQQQLPHMAAQPGDLYPFPPPPYEPPEQVSTQRQLETRIAIPGLDINQFTRPPPPPYDEELQRSEPFKLN
ncbi:hypothetical protein AVEN_12306-1 [Araneus ventricosus]|uniref:Uncharacterized protein n=1 Tax=Araneus ventricosus TaxID=182803 RepID=A0A4Y2EAJ3_ARAVE|nr:hypothetical protein AVEN_12306-1 [Araneus ventricosus]